MKLTVESDVRVSETGDVATLSVVVGSDGSSVSDGGTTVVVEDRSGRAE